MTKIARPLSLRPTIEISAAEPLSIAYGRGVGSPPEEASITEQFFDETTEQSQAKATIVAKYFWAWANVIMPTVEKVDGRIAYIDLFAGPGRYKDGTDSTPIKVLQQAVADQKMRKRLVTVFNDADADHSQSLEKAIKRIPGIDKLRYQPEVNNEEVGDKIVQMFETKRLVPTLFFVDPWGYKGLSLRLVNSVLKDWGCDCIFFFNYNRINMGLNNDRVEEHMNALFGEDRANQLRERLDGLKAEERELAIVEDIASALKEMGGEYVLPFRFRNDRGQRTSHHLIFVSKHFKGYEIMKEIMAKESTRVDQGVASFEYNPADRRQPLLFEYTQPLDALGKMILKEFSGQRLTVAEIYKRHNVGRPYIKKNYKAALIALEAEGRVTASEMAAERRAGTMADRIEITFPRRKS